VGIVQHGLVTQRYAEDLTQDLGGFASRKSKRDVEGQDQTEDVRAAMDASQIDGQSKGCGRFQLSWLEMILPVLVTQLELGRAQFLQESLLPNESGFSLQIVRTGVVITLVDGAVRALFPAVESPLTVGTPVDGLAGSIARGQGRESRADFAEDLSGLTAIVEVEVVGRSLAVATTTSFRDLALSPSPDGSKRLSLLFLILRQELFPIQDRQRAERLRRFIEGSPCIHIEVPIVGMLFSEGVSGLDFRFPLGKHLLQLPDDLFEFLSSEVLTQPKNKACYFCHGGSSRFFSPFDYQREETKPPLPSEICGKTAPNSSPNNVSFASFKGETTRNRGEGCKNRYYCNDFNQLAA
jgi:hypothetical protein